MESLALSYSPRVLEEICEEIRKFGEPANPALSEVLVEAYRVLKAGGALVGFYGMGKSLLANLAAAYSWFLGEKGVVLKAYEVMRVEEDRASLMRISTLGDLKKIFDCDASVGWFGRFGRRRLDRPPIGDEQIRIRGRGFDRVVGIVDELRGSGYSLVVIDEMERLVERPEAYGFKSLQDFIEDFFYFVDRSGGVGLAVPTSLWAYLDLQTRSRIAPTFFLSHRITPEHMARFLERKLEQLPERANIEKLRGIRFRNPRVVVRFVRDVAARGVEGALRLRIDALRRIAERYRAGASTQKALFLAYVAAWIRQNAYDEFTEEDLERARDLSQVSTPLDDAVRRLRRNKLVRKTGWGYLLAPKALNHMSGLLSSEEGTYVIDMSLGEDLVTVLRLELSLV